MYSVGRSIFTAINKKCGQCLQMNRLYRYPSVYPISSGEFSCQTTRSSVIYRSEISGTTDLLTAPQLVDLIREWINEDGTILVNAFRLHVRRGCPLQIKSLSDRECVTDEVEEGDAQPIEPLKPLG